MMRTFCCMVVLLSVGITGCGRKAETIRVKLANGGACLAEESPAGRSRELLAGLAELAGPQHRQTLMLFRCNQFDSCRAVLGAILKTEPSDWQAHYLLGLIDFRWEHLEGARHNFETALLFSPQDKKSRAVVYAALASTLETLREFGRARQHFLTAYNLDPESVPALDGLRRLTAMTDAGDR